MALIDEFRKRMQEQQQPVQQMDAQAALQRLAQAKTGKAAAGPQAPKASAIGQSVAQQQVASQGAQQAQQANVGMEQLAAGAAAQQSQIDLFRQRLAAEQQASQAGMAAKGTLAAESLAGNEARATKQLTSQEDNKLNMLSSDMRNKLQGLASERRITTDDIFESFRQDTADLEMRKDAAQLEQYAFQAALANKAYLQELDAIGKTRLLENDLNFKKEYTNIKLGDATSALLEQLGWKTAFDADERAFQEQMGKMDIDSAIAVANTAIQQSNTQAVFSGATQAAGTYVKDKAAADKEAAAIKAST
jgi:hypothetical protein